MHTPNHAHNHSYYPDKVVRYSQHIRDCDFEEEIWFASRKSNPIYHMLFAGIAFADLSPKNLNNRRN